MAPAARASSTSLELSVIQHFSSFHIAHPPSSSFLWIFLCPNKSPLPSLLLPYRRGRSPRVLAVVGRERKSGLGYLGYAEDEKEIVGVVGAADEPKRRTRPCELYVCNLPRSYDISDMIELFRPHGTVLSVEVSRDSQTGISRGCGYVTMASISEARSVIAALDGTDISGREMRVKFSVDMVSGRKNAVALNSTPKKNIIFEGPYKIYVGNLSRSMRPQVLMEHFSQFGTVISTRVVHDCKRGKNRAYAFISFSTADEVMAATEANGSELCGRIMSVRDVSDPDQ